MIFLLVVLARPAGAQEIGRIFPNGARRGATVTLTLSGKNLPDTASLVVDGEGIKPLGPFTKGVGKVEIAPDAEPGVRQLRLAGAKVATTPRPFSIGTLPELDEKEPNNTPEQAQRLEALPVTLNGSLPTRPDIDVFRVSLKQGECLVVAGEARVLGAPTNLLVRIRDTRGRELLTQMDYRTRDPLLGFTAPAAGEYLVELQEVMNNYSTVTEEYVYRVTLTTGPWVDRVFPPGARRGETARLTFTGWNLGGQPGPSQVKADVPIPPDAAPRYPVAAGGAQNRVMLATGPHPEAVEREAEPANGPGATATARPPQPLSQPATVSGTFGARGEVDVYQFTAREGERLLLDVDAREIGSFADPVMVVADAAGKALATVDDAEGGRDPRLLWTAPAAGTYAVRLRDVAGGSRSGPEYFYRLTVALPPPLLRVTTPASTVTLKPGGKLEVPLTLVQSDLPGAVTFSVEGLPPGVTAAPLAVPASSGKELKLVLTGAPDLPPGFASLRIVASCGALAPVPATATWVLSTDRSGTLAQGSTDRLLLLVPAP